MKILTLNIWGGRAGKAGLLDFFSRHKNVDIFCLQEVWSAPYEHLEGHPAGGVQIDNSKIMVYGLQEISEVLKDHRPYFRPHHGDHYGLLMLVSNRLRVQEEGEVFVFKDKGHVPEGDVGNHARNLQFVKILDGEKELTVMNIHGLWNGKGKTDSNDRIEQSKKIINFTAKIAGEYVLCGDFNLLPDTQSARLLEDSGMKNLIKEYNVTSTRTSLYSKPEKYADYIFVSPGVEIKNFSVMPDVVSDHAPLFLEV